MEMRSPDEVTEMGIRSAWLRKESMYNPLPFDVTDHSLITGIITGEGDAARQHDKAFEALGIGGKHC